MVINSMMDLMFRDGGKMFKSLIIEDFTSVPNYS